ncbi:MAG: hypothetical protein PUF57_02080 [Clostridiaceae bacterium]|nr:hypothetical protein [Clostridiaceae bacterium]
MAKALKTIAIVSVFALVISSFNACSLPFGTEDPTTEVPTTELTEITEENSTAETETTSETTTEQEKQEKIEDIFADIKNFEIGTAGSSAKAAELALRLIAFSNSELAESDTVEADIKALVDTLGENTDDYGEALYQINSFAKKFFGGKEKDVVQTAGDEDFSLEKEYSQDKYQKVFDLLNNI